MRKAGARLKPIRLSWQTGRVLYRVNGQPTENGFEGVDAGLQIFEKKAKEPKLDAEVAVAEAGVAS
ncbi:MAG: hypothetical protein ACRAVC_17415 [Trichormus sp.]|jgi:hypothetical protein